MKEKDRGESDNAIPDIFQWNGRKKEREREIHANFFFHHMLNKEGPVAW